MKTVINSLREEIVSAIRNGGPRVGELDPSELAETTLNPAKRRMKQVTMQDEALVARMFSDLMGTSVSPRKRFIEENAEKANVAI